MRCATVRRWLFVAVCGGTLLGSGCLDATQLQAAAASGVQVFIASAINTFLQGLLSSVVGT